MTIPKPMMMMMTMMSWLRQQSFMYPAKILVLGIKDKHINTRRFLPFNSYNAATEEQLKQKSMGNLWMTM